MMIHLRFKIIFCFLMFIFSLNQIFFSLISFSCYQRHFNPHLHKLHHIPFNSSFTIFLHSIDILGDSTFFFFNSYFFPLIITFLIFNILCMLFFFNLKFFSIFDQYLFITFYISKFLMCILKFIKGNLTICS